jgi:hypothetical protein
VPEPSAFEFEFEFAIEEMKSHILPGNCQIPSELIKAGSKTIFSEIHELIISIWNKEELPEEWKESITVSVFKKGDKTDCSTYRDIWQLHTKFYPPSCCQG